MNISIITNPKRIHPSIGYKTPGEVYNNWLKSCNVEKAESLQSIA